MPRHDLDLLSEANKGNIQKMNADRMNSHVKLGEKAAILFQEVERYASVCFETTESEWVFRVSDGQVDEC